jgi:hypothetical protein
MKKTIVPKPKFAGPPADNLILFGKRAQKKGRAEEEGNSKLSKFLRSVEAAREKKI